MFSMPTSGPLSPTVSLERKKLEQAGVPPGQEQQGAAAKGMPISGDLAQLIQLNRMLQQKGAMQQQANPAPSTVAQDLMQQVMQQQAPQMQRTPQMPPQMDPRQQGIAQLPQEAVGNGMAAGGIVAFDDGGSVRHFDAGGLTAAELEEFNKLRNLQFTGYDPHSLTNEAGISTSSDVSAAQDQTAKRYRELLVRKYAADQAAEQAAKEQAQAAKVSGVLSQYGLDAPPAPPAPSPPAASSSSFFSSSFDHKRVFEMGDIGGEADALESDDWANGLFMRSCCSCFAGVLPPDTETMRGLCDNCCCCCCCC